MSHKKAQKAHKELNWIAMSLTDFVPFVLFCG